VAGGGRPLELALPLQGINPDCAPLSVWLIRVSPRTRCGTAGSGGISFVRCPFFLGRAASASADAGTIHSGIYAADQLADADERTNSAWTQKVRCVIGSITGASAMLVIEGGELPAQKLN
jgi:hypothetical protein